MLDQSRGDHILQLFGYDYIAVCEAVSSRLETHSRDCAFLRLRFACFALSRFELELKYMFRNHSDRKLFVVLGELDSRFCCSPGLGVCCSAGIDCLDLMSAP